LTGARLKIGATGSGKDLRILASGKRSGLTASQQEILELWPADVSNATLQEAASNVRWQLGQSDRFLGGLRRSGAYRSHINQVIREKDLPIELAVLPHVESSFNPGAYSSAACCRYVAVRPRHRTALYANRSHR
jgi:membrane-bound lytic murein transglycosylase D